MEHSFTWLSTLPFVHDHRVPENAMASILVTLVLMGFAFFLRPRLSNIDQAVQPEDGVSARNIGEQFVEMISGIAEGVIGHHYERYVPLLASFFAFILLSNLLGLLPGFSPPTSNVNTTFALGLVSFLAYNFYGLREGGLKYLKHFMGPMLVLAPLMVLIELMSHAFRPLSLGIRLFANMFADHELISIFTGLTKIGVPVLFYFLGLLVCVVQAFVFTMLTAVYITLAVSHDEH
jgi:F-type H+-transporting ATPase subunit a